MKALLYIQIIAGLLSYSIVAYINFCTRPLANFENEIQIVEKIISNASGLDLNDPKLAAPHHFILALYAANQFSYYVVLFTCTILCFSGVVCLSILAKKNK